MQNGDMWSKRQGYRLPRTLKRWLLISGILVTIITLLLIIVTVVKNHELAEVKNYEYTLMQEVAELDVLSGQKKLLEDTKQQLDTRFGKIQKVTCVSKNNPYQYLRAIEKIIPERMVLTHFTFDRLTIKLEGAAYTVQEVTKFMRALAQSKLVKLPQLASLDRGKGKNKKKLKNVDHQENAEGSVQFIIDVTKV